MKLAFAVFLSVVLIGASRFALAGRGGNSARLPQSIGRNPISGGNTGIGRRSMAAPKSMNQRLNRVRRR